MEIEKLKVEFFEKFGQQSFRGYPLEQCHSIWEFFLPHIQSRQAAVSGNEVAVCECVNRLSTYCIADGKYRCGHCHKLIYPA